MQRALLFFNFVLGVASSPAAWQSIGNVDSVSVGGNRVFVRSGTAFVEATVLKRDMVRIRCSPSGSFLPGVSWAVDKTHWPAATVRIRDTDDEVSATTDEMTVAIKKRPLRVIFRDKGGTILNEDDPSKGMSWSGSEWRVWKTMPGDEYYYGLGEKAGRLQRKYSHTTMWNSDIPGYTAATDPLYQTIPFFYGLRNGRSYGIFIDDSYWSSFDFGKESRDQYSFGAENGDIDYYFFSGPSPSKVLSRFTELVGHMPLPPRWSLGYQQCRWSYSPEGRVREIARGFRSRKIPCDVIYLDIDYMDGYRIFTWNKTAFPDPKRMISDLGQQGFKIAVIVDPGIKEDTSYEAYRSGREGNHFLKYPDGRTFIGKVWPGECAFPDFTSATARAWWGENFSILVRSGVQGWWNDMNEPSVFDVPTKTIDLDVIHDDNGLMTLHSKNHNVYGMLMTRATYEGVRKLVPTERPFVLTRASFAGGQRYSAAWTGDNVASWDHLRMAVSMCLSMSISGQPFVGSDIGGFIGYPSGELFARWLQLGVFCPLMRAHSVINEKNKEPWEYGDEFTTINRETIDLRYQLLPYIYGVMHQASFTGQPAMRPMMFAYPEDSEFVWNDDEFMFGDDLLVAPVVLEGARTRELRLPAGRWFDYWTEKPFDGDRTITIDSPLDRIPLFARAGAVIPTQQVVQYTDQAPIDPLTLTVYPTDFQSNDSSYEDDGKTFDYERGVYLKRSYNQWSSQSTLTLTVAKGAGSYVPPKRTVIFRFVDFNASPKTVEVSGRVVNKTTPEQFSNGVEGWMFQQDSGILSVRTPEELAERQIIIRR